MFKRKGDKRRTIAWFDHEGKRREKSSGTTDKRLAERIAGEWGNREIERQQGLVDPVAERLSTERARPLAAHLDDYEAHLESLQRSARHIEGTMRYLRKLADALEWRTLASIDAHALTSHLSDQADLRGTGARTFNAAVIAWRAFGRRCVRSNRLATNPLGSFGTRNQDADRRRVRRDHSTDELARIIEAAMQSPSVTVTNAARSKGHELRTVQVRMNYPERAWAYRIAAGTGFRAGEVASLTPETCARVGLHSLTRVLDGMPEAGTKPTRDSQTMRARRAPMTTRQVVIVTPRRNPRTLCAKPGNPARHRAAKAAKTRGGSMAASPCDSQN